MGLLLVALAGFAGGVFSALMGWLRSGERSLDARKFGNSVGAALLAALGLALGYSFSDGIGVRDLFVSFLAGAGVDGLSHRTVGGVQAIAMGGRKRHG